MAGRIWAGLSFSNVIAMIALFVALGGTVYAASTISGKEITKGSIPGNRLKKGAVTGKQLKKGSIPGDRLKQGAVTGSQVAQGSVPGDRLQANSVTGSQVAQGSVPGDRLQANSVTGSQVDENTLETVPSATVGGPVAFAAVNANGTVNPARSRGITNANITTAGLSSYCFKNLPSFSGAQATITYNTAGELASNTIARVALPDFPGTAIFNTDCPGSQLEVATSDSGGGVQHAFFLAVYR